MVFKMYLFVLVPFMLVLIGAFFGVASVPRALAALLVLAVGMVGALINIELTLANMLYYLFAGGACILVAPSVAAFFAFTAKPVSPSSAEVTFTSAKEAYRNLSPEQQAALRSAGVRVAKVGAKCFAEHLRSKGKVRIAAGIDEIVGK